VAELLKKKLGIQKGSAIPNRTKVAKINRQQASEIAKEKMQDMNAADIDDAIDMVLGTARSMGIDYIP
jgi:large subunit ribosomal protein L11